MSKILDRDMCLIFLAAVDFLVELTFFVSVVDISIAVSVDFAPIR